MTQNPCNNLEWALAYAAAGFAVLPVWWPAADGVSCSCAKGAGCDRPAKHPIPRQGVLQATTSPERIRAWWDEYPDANVGLATGERSDLILIDVDTGGEKEGDVSITTACAERGGVPRTLKARSGSGGVHYAYTWRANQFTRKIGFLKHVDYLSDGGYVIVQPSRNLKGAYRWEIDTDADDADPEVVVAALRGEMRELPQWFDALEGTGRAGKKGGAKQRNTDALKSRIVNAASMEFKATDPRWIEEVQKALTFCDPDSRDDWVLFGIILGREFERNDDGWRLYNEWAARSSKYEDAGTQRAMRGYFYDDSTTLPQGGEAATIATILRRAQEGGWFLPPGGVDRRPVIAYRAGRAIETLNTVLTLMARERESESDATLRVYAFGSGLGSVIETHDYGALYTAEGRPPNGWVLRVSAYTQMGIGSRITHTATIVKFSATGSTQQVECPAEISSLLLSDYSKHFPRLNGIVQWPLVMGGRVAGFDEAYEPKAGLFFSLPENADFSSLRGTKKEALAAWEWMQRVAFAEFPFGTARDQAAALALMLTFMQRRAMDAAPAFLVTAPIQGTGKSALIKFASRTVHGRTVGAAALSLVSEEQRKTITAALLTNPPCLFFDNLQAGTAFDSKELAIAMTSGEWEDRRLGSTERLSLPNRAVWCFTGNNISLVNDLRRRFVTIRMIPKTRAHYEQRFSRELDSWAVEHRGEVLAALLAILLWGAKAEIELKSESGFPAWDSGVRRVVFGLTGVDPFHSLSEQTEDTEQDETEEAINVIASAWAVVMGEDPSIVKRFVDRCHEFRNSSNPLRRRLAEGVDGAVAALRGKQQPRLEPADYGYALKMLQDRPLTIDGLDASFVRRGTQHQVACWKLTGAAAIAAKIEANEF